MRAVKFPEETDDAGVDKDVKGLRLKSVDLERE